jgi:hypothetical protein
MVFILHPTVWLGERGYVFAFVTHGEGGVRLLEGAVSGSARERHSGCVAVTSQSVENQSLETWS